MTTHKPDAEREARALCDELYWMACSSRSVSDERLDAYAEAIRAESAAEIAALKDTVRSLNRRCQQAESAARVTVAECERQGVSLGRGLAGFAYAEAKREVEALRADGERWRAFSATASMCSVEPSSGYYLSGDILGGVYGMPSPDEYADALIAKRDAARASETRGRA